MVALNLNVISKVSLDANLRYVFEGVQKRKYDGKVDLADLTRLTEVNQLQPGIDLYIVVVWHISLKRKIRKSLSLDIRRPNKPTYIVLFSTDIYQSAEEIYRFYKLSFQSMPPIGERLR